MISRKKAIELTDQYEHNVYTTKEDIAQLVYMHCQLGLSEMEVFVDKKFSLKCVSMLEKKGFYCRIIKFKALENEVRLYVSWISNIGVLK